MPSSRMFDRWKPAVGAAALLCGLLACAPDRPAGDDDVPGDKKPTPPPTGPIVIGETTNECKKVDILFVIDDSGSMGDNQVSLVKSFPGFIKGIQDRLKSAQDVHIGVVTSDNYYYNTPGCTDIGSLVSKTGGPASSNRLCGPFDGGGKYLLGSDSKLLERFACIAQVGAGGSDDERMARGLLNAVSAKNAAPGGCNAGFLRPDSLLVVVLITDEDDVPDGCEGPGMCQSYGSGGTPDEWYAEFVKARPVKDSTVVLSLLGRRSPNACGAVAASRLMRLTNQFGKNAFLGDICAASYDQFFVDALPLVQDACKIYSPPPG